uniref:THUMP domain-containing protein 3-like n=1 Tax=Phallusia mammillata TaxID=59560 RepID=A0A6F9DVQ7_9ASCI|nr:THUMP domain-containing protein 3-like [Phallusia mammillata]
MELEESIQDFVDSDSMVTIGATVVTGFEKVAMEEIKEKIEHIDMTYIRGKIFIQMLPKAISGLHKLLSVDNLFLVIKYVPHYVYPDEKEIMLKSLAKFPVGLPWDEVTKFWRLNLEHCKKPNKNKQSSKRVPNKHDMENNSEVRFRVTSSRAGKSQCVTSPDADLHFGGALQDVTNWTVDLSHYNMEIFFSMGFDAIMISMSLTYRSLHHRHISHFGKTTLKSTIAHNMLRLCNIQTGDFVVDPMCGSGVIPIEGYAQWKNAFYLAADNAHPAIVRSSSNVKFLNKEYTKTKFPIDVLHWDATRMPWRTATVDVCVTDLPFGKRLGSQADNRKLYPSFLHEMARVSRLRTARACLLTHDKRSIITALAKVSSLWKIKQSHTINIGGLRAGVYLLQRTITLAKDVVL